MKNDLLLILKMRCVNKNVKNQYIYSHPININPRVKLSAGNSFLNMSFGICAWTLLTEHSLTFVCEFVTSCRIDLSYLLRLHPFNHVFICTSVGWQKSFRQIGGNYKSKYKSNWLIMGESTSSYKLRTNWKSGIWGNSSTMYMTLSSNADYIPSVFHRPNNISISFRNIPGTISAELITLRRTFERAQIEIFERNCDFSSSVGPLTADKHLTNCANQQNPNLWRVCVND